MEEQNKKANKFVFALPRAGASILMGISDFALLFLYADAYNLNGLFVGLALMGGKLSIGFFQFFFGWISDHTHTRWGRRKPYIFLLSPIMTIAFIFLMLPGLFLGVDPTQVTLFLWFLFTNIAFQGSYSLTTPYQAWLAELFKNEERPRVSAYQNIFNFIGNGVMTAFSFVVLTSVKSQMSKNPNIVPPHLVISAIIFGIIPLVLFYINALLMPVESTPEYKTHLKEDFIKMFKNKNFILITIMQGMAFLSISLTTSQLLGFTQSVLDLDTKQYMILAVFLSLTLMFGIFMWVKSIGKRGKKATLLTIFLEGMIILPFTLLGFYQTTGLFIFGVIFVPIVGTFLAGWYIFPYLIYADVAEDDQKKDGELKAGMYSGFPNTVLNIFQAFGLLLSGWILDLPKIQMLSGAVSIGQIMWGPIAGIFLLFTYLYTRHFVKLDFSWEKRSSNIIKKFKDGLK